ncbi:TPA: SLATT domain-containing protein [Citrobacter amalonaticus]|uniref:SLATT domain-containing protein n=1 Tax=Citrobacter amalonaticus TaxID=35703 RepID=UPI001D4AB1F6|nr:SLATT domain-containing protein [Escherichia coli]HCB3504631.1 SLATT domain-containing protein [Citrobacter amalonaticus]
MSDFSDRVWWTKKSRIKAEKRLLKLDFISQALLLWYSVFLASYSIITLVIKVKNDAESAIMVALSVMVLVVTLFVNNMKFKERAMLMKQCYEQVGDVYSSALVSEDLQTLDKEYQSILSISENHKEIDFYRAVVEEFDNAKTKTDISKHPTDKQRNIIHCSNAIWGVVVVFLAVFPFLVVWFFRSFAQVCQ